MGTRPTIYESEWVDSCVRRPPIANPDISATSSMWGGVMEDISKVVLRIFASRTKNFKGKSAIAEAQKESADQKGYYNNLFSIARSISYMDDTGKPQNLGGEFVGSIHNWCMTVLNAEPPVILSGDEKTDRIVYSQLPVINSDDLDELRAIAAIVGRQDKALYFRNILAVAPLMERSAQMRGVAAEQVDTRDQADLAVAMSDYATAKALAAHRPMLDTAVDEQLKRQKLNADGITRQLLELAQTYRDGFGQLELSSTDLASKISDLETRKNEIRDSLNNYEAAIRQELGLDRARENWSKRYKEAHTSFKNTSLLLGGMIALPFLLAFLAGPAVVRFVNNFDLTILLGAGGSGAVFGHFLTRLVIISVPLFAYLWGLRVVIRYFTRSMTLKDDARMRETMLDTYFMLVEAGRADEASRPIILNALFRPAPGHGTEGTEPPEMAAYLESIAKMGRP